MGDDVERIASESQQSGVARWSDGAWHQFGPAPSASSRGGPTACGTRSAAAANAASGKPKLLDQVRLAVRARQLSPRTEEAYVGWVRRYVLFHGKRHPAGLNADALSAFLTDLAVTRNVSPSTQNQAASALLFLYREVLGIQVAPPDGVARPRKPRRLPIVLSRQEVALVLAEMSGQSRLVASVLYGSGLRLLEALQLRVKACTSTGMS